MKKTIRRAAVGVLTGALALTGAMGAPSASVAVEQRVTNFAFNGWAYGTYAAVEAAGVSSSPTAYSWLGCTRKTGLVRERSVAAADIPNPSPALSVGAVASRSRTYEANGRVGMRSTNRVAEVVLGPTDGPHLVIKGLSTVADASARRGVMSANATFTSTDIAAVAFPEEAGPLGDLLNQAGAGIGTLLEQLAQNGNLLEIPGLGVIRLGNTYNKVYTRYAYSNATALRVHLYGPDQLASTNDDVDVVIGRSYARIAKEVPFAVMGGNARAVSGKVTVADAPILTVGPISEASMSCEGTRGKIRSFSTAGVNLLNQGVAVTGTANARVFGEQYDTGKVKAWTEAGIAGVNLGSGDTAVEIKDIVGRANVVRSPKGTYYKSIGGSRVGSVTIGGEVVEVPDPGQAIEIPGLAKIEFFVRSSTLNSINVTAVRITLLDGTAVINLGAAKAHIRRT